MFIVRILRAVIQCIVLTIFPFIGREIEEQHRDREQRLDDALHDLLAEVNASTVYAFGETDAERAVRGVRRRLALAMLSTSVRIDRTSGHEGSLKSRHLYTDASERRGFKTIYRELFLESYEDLKKVLREMNREQLAWFLQFIGAEQVGEEFRLLRPGKENKTSRP